LIQLVLKRLDMQSQVWQGFPSPFTKQLDTFMLWDRRLATKWRCELGLFYLELS